MILTCPDCATRYFVDDAKVGAAGKTVRCAQCGARWKATLGAEELELKPSAAAEPVTKAAAPEPPASLPKRFRAQVQEKKSIRRAVTHGVVWASMAGVLAVALFISIIFRVEVVSMMPRAASAYAMVGLPVNAIGLTFEEISAHPALQDGHAALVVSGAVRNIEDRAASAPAVRIDVLDAYGKVIATSFHALEDADIPAGEAKHFVLSVLDPPAEAHDVQVAFALGAEGRAAQAARGAASRDAAPEMAAPVLRGETVADEGELSLEDAVWPDELPGVDAGAGPVEAAVPEVAAE